MKGEKRYTHTHFTFQLRNTFESDSTHPLHSLHLVERSPSLATRFHSKCKKTLVARTLRNHSIAMHACDITPATSSIMIFPLRLCPSMFIISIGHRTSPELVTLSTRNAFREQFKLTGSLLCAAAPLCARVTSARRWAHGQRPIVGRRRAHRAARGRVAAKSRVNVALISSLKPGTAFFTVKCNCTDAFKRPARPNGQK